MQFLPKTLLVTSVLIAQFAHHANGSYFHANVKEGAEFFMFDVRFPFMPSGTYFSFWNGKFFPVGGAFYGGVFTRGPGKTVGPENLKHGTPWTYWGDNAYNGDRPRPVYIGEYTNANGAGGEGSAAAVGGAKPFLRRGVWFTMCKRVWEPAEKNASYRYEGWWIKDRGTGKWHLSAVMLIPAPVTGYSGWSTFVEELAKGADRVIEMRRFYCRLNREWHSVDTISMDNKYKARFSLIENNSAFHYEDPVDHTAGTTGRTSWTVKQPGKPVFEKPVIEDVQARALGGQVAVSWTIPETAVPQLGYRIEVLADDGKPIADFTEMMPHIQMKTLDTQEGRAKRVRLTIIDIFENQVTKEIPVSTGEAQTGKNVAPKIRPGLGYELFKLDDEGTLETPPTLASLRDKDGWNKEAKEGFMRTGILPTLVLPPREMWDRKRSQYAVRYTGNLHVPKTGFYIFELAAAGSSRLQINGKTVGDNGFHANPSARRYIACLEAGPHLFDLLYCKKAWVNQRGLFQLRWEGPGMPLRSFSESDFTVPDRGDIPILNTTCKPSDGKEPANVVDISVDVDGGGQTVSRIDVFCGDLILAQLTQPPYNLESVVLPDGDFDISARVVYEGGKRTVDSNRIPDKSKGTVLIEPWKQDLIGVRGVGLGIVKEEKDEELSLRITGDSHWFLNQEVEGDFSLSGRLVDFPTRTWRDPVYGHVKSRSWMGLMFSLKPGEPCFYNAYGFYRLAGEGWRGTPCHGDLAGSRRTNYQYPDDTGDWIRLERQDMLFSTYRSRDGISWKLVRHCLISPRSKYAWRKGVAGVTFRQQASDPGGGWAQGRMDQVTLKKGRIESPPKRSKVKPEDASLFNGRVLAVVQSPSAPKLWYARTYGSGILKSMDGGNSWTEANGNLGASQYVRSIAVHPEDGNVVLVGIGACEGGKSSGGLYKTKDGGASWHRASDKIDFDGKGPSALLGEVISFNPQKPNVIAAGGESKGLFLSENGGESWQRVDVAGPLKCGAHRISSLQYNKSLDGHLTVGTFPDAEFKVAGLGMPACKIPEQKGGGIYSVGEKKISWGIQSYPGFGFPSVHLNHPKGFGGEGFFSTTRGAFKWHRSGLIHSWPNVPHNSFWSQIAVGKDANGTRDILVAAPFSSDDSNPISVWSKGKLAKEVSSPVPLNAGISGIAFDLSNPSQRLLVCNRHGILRSNDRGKTYELVYAKTER
ncbi:MAG: hypothetical protein HN467_15515 [Opitutae bacterium]|nr:hypothetical protein [Opitutae bacterium]